MAERVCHHAHLLKLSDCVSRQRTELALILGEFGGRSVVGFLLNNEEDSHSCPCLLLFAVDVAVVFVDMLMLVILLLLSFVFFVMILLQMLFFLWCCLLLMWTLLLLLLMLLSMLLMLLLL